MGCNSLSTNNSQSSTDNSLIGTIWTRIDLSDDPDPPQDWQFIEDGVLVTLMDNWRNNTWIQDGISVTISINDNYAAYMFEIINSDLMKGTANNIAGLEWPVELRKNQ